jgi:ElaB/YqjD/DUF883 family membrane-anchored ribosome-binding protein
MSDKKNSDELQVLRDDLAQLRADMRELVSTVGRIGEDASSAVAGQASRLAEGVRGSAEDAYAQVVREGKRYAKDGRKYARSLERSLEENVVEHPFGSMAIALAIGLVIGKILDRPHR